MLTSLYATYVSARSFTLVGSLRARQIAQLNSVPRCVAPSQWKVLLLSVRVL